MIRKSILTARPERSTVLDTPGWADAATVAPCEVIDCTQALKLRQEAKAKVARYDTLRGQLVSPMSNRSDMKKLSMLAIVALV